MDKVNLPGDVAEVVVANEAQATVEPSELSVKV